MGKQSDTLQIAGLRYRLTDVLDELERTWVIVMTDVLDGPERT